MQVKKKLEEILIENGLVSEEQLQIALSLKKPFERLDQVLIRLNYLTEQDITNALGFQLGISQLKLSENLIDERITRLLPESLAKRYNALPVKLEQGILTVAMTDPLDFVALDHIQLVTGFKVEAVVVTEAELAKAFQLFYGGSEITGPVLEELESAGFAEQAELSDLKLDGADSDAPVVRVVNMIIEQAVYMKASDIHLEPMEDVLLVRFRIDGFLKKIFSLPKDSSQAIVSRIKIMADMDIAEKRLPQDGRIQLTVNNNEIDLRCSSIPTVFGEKIVLRVLDKTNAILDLELLGFRPELLTEYRKIISVTGGMVLLTGPAGSGKTTTLYATLQHLNAVAKNIITIEDPVEYILPGINQVGVNNKAGLTFARGLRSILRQDPDIIMIGEIRDRETADIAVRAATTGHLVLSTLHTNDAAGALPRLIDMGAENYLVASALTGVMAQRLVRKICPSCKEECLISANSPQGLFMGLDKDMVFYRGRGCRNCASTGYRGRLAIHELLRVTSRIRNLIMDKAPAATIKKIALTEGMVTLKEDGLFKALQGLTTIDEIMRVANIE